MKLKFTINQEIRKIMTFLFVVHFPVVYQLSVVQSKHSTNVSSGRRRTIRTSCQFLALWLNSISQL